MIYSRLKLWTSCDRSAKDVCEKCLICFIIYPIEVHIIYLFSTLVSYDWQSIEGSKEIQYNHDTKKRKKCYVFEFLGFSRLLHIVTKTIA